MPPAQQHQPAAPAGDELLKSRLQGVVEQVIADATEHHSVVAKQSLLRARQTLRQLVGVLDAQTVILVFRRAYQGHEPDGIVRRHRAAEELYLEARLALDMKHPHRIAAYVHGAMGHVVFCQGLTG